MSDVSGMSFGSEQTYTVQLSPEGLFFYEFAILTITPAQPIAIDEQLVFGYQADGKDVILAAPVVDSTEIKILVRPLQWQRRDQGNPGCARCRAEATGSRC